MPKLTEKQKQFLKKHNMWNASKDKSKLGILDEGNFKDFFRRKEKVEEELARLPDEVTKQNLVLRLQAAEEKAKNKKFKEAYKDLQQVKKEAKEAAESYVSSLSPEKLGKEVAAWKLEGENLRPLLEQFESGKSTARSDFAKVGEAAPFGSVAEAEEYLRGLETAESLARSQLVAVQNVATKITNYLSKNNPAAKLQNFGHQLSMLRKEKNADVSDLDQRVESAHVPFIHKGKTLKADDIQSSVGELTMEIENGLEGRKDLALKLAGQVRWETRYPGMSDRVLTALQKGPIERARIEGAWAMANARAEKDTAADYEAALTILGDLGPVLDNATAENIGTDGAVGKTGAALVEARELQSAQVLLAAKVATAKEVLARIRKEFEPTLPTALNVQALKLDGLVAPSTETDPAKVRTLAGSVAEEAQKLDDLAVAPRTERATWKDTLAAFLLQLATLTNHPLKNETTTVKPLIDKINEDLEKAKLKGNAMKWTEATEAVKLLVPRCETAVQTADGFSHFAAIRQERADRLATLPAEGTITQEQPRKAVVAAHKLLTDADVEKNGKKYPAAIALLNKIPAAVDRAALLVAKANSYDSQIGTYEGFVTELGNYTGMAKTAIQTGLVQFKKGINQAKIVVTKDYTVSMTLLGQAYGLYKSLKAKATQAMEYKDALDAFKLRYTEIKNHTGRVAIEEFFARMQNDQSFAETRKNAGEFQIGAKILAATDPLHAEQLALAVIAEGYKTKHKKAGEDIVELEKKGNKGKAAEVLAEARRRITAAENMATAKDWPGAVKAIDQAAVTITAATKLLADDQALANLKNGPKLDAIATDFNAAFAVYLGMRNHVKGKDTGNVFVARLATADAPAQAAKDASKTSPANFVLARSQLDAAIAICEATLLLVSKKAPYDTALAALKIARDPTLKDLNEDDCIGPKLTEIDDAILRAENLAKTPTFNFDGAQQEIGAALVKVREAERNATAYTAMKPHKQTIADTLTFLREPARSAGVADEIQRLVDAETSINNDVTAGKVPEAAKTAAAAAALCPQLRKVGEKYASAVVQQRDWVTNKIPEIEGAGKAAAAPELVEAKAYGTSVQKLMDDHNYALVEGIAGNCWFRVEAGKEMIAAEQLYEPSRSLAETKLNNALPNRNAATEDLYKALKKRYDDAVLLVTNERNYKRAKGMLDTIPAETNGLAAPAQGFRDYETSKKKAEDKLEEARNKNASAIQPLLANLQARLEAAVKTATGGDYVGAKNLLDAIFLEAGNALTIANDASEYAKAAEDVKDPGKSGITDAMAKAKKLYQDLMARPESLYAVSTLAGINQTIEAATKAATTDENNARTLLGQVVDACAKARVLMGHYEQMETRMQTLNTEIKNFEKSHAQAAFFKTETQKLRDDIEAARREARGTGNHVNATKQIQTVDTTFLTLRRAANAHVEYVARKGLVEAELTKMDEHKARYAIVAQIATVRDALAQAATKTTAHDHKAAMALLDTAMQTAQDALLKAKMHLEETEPTVAEVKEILKGKDGSKRLDAIVATLDPKAQRKVLDLAFEARFDCKLTRFASNTEEDNLATWKKDHPTATPLEIEQQELLHSDQNKATKAPDARRFYDLMCELPDTHTKDNDSMQVFVQVGGPAKGSDYAGGKSKKVAMREGDVATSGIYGVLLPHEIDELEAGCEPANGEPITYFNWNTVHEVGHAVDDKLGFMKGRGKAYAGWVEYGSNARPVAEAVAGKYSYDVAYVTAYIAKASPVVPEPDGCDAEEWERRRVACCAWVDSARAGNNPWSSASTAKALEIGGKVYHESYDSGSWASYNLSARKQGVTGYQFRAPGEWFSELYAAFHTKKLKPSHPAYAWLQTL